MYQCTTQASHGDGTGVSSVDADLSSADLFGDPGEDRNPQPNAAEKDGDPQPDAAEKDGDPQSDAAEKDGDPQSDAAEKDGDPQPNAAEKDGDPQPNAAEKDGDPQLNAAEKDGDSQPNAAEKDGDSQPNAAEKDGDPQPDAAEKDGDPQPDAAGKDGDPQLDAAGKDGVSVNTKRLAERSRKLGDDDAHKPTDVGPLGLPLDDRYKPTGRCIVNEVVHSEELFGAPRSSEKLAKLFQHGGNEHQRQIKEAAAIAESNLKTREAQGLQNLVHPSLEPLGTDSSRNNPVVSEQHETEKENNGHVEEADESELDTTFMDLASLKHDLAAEMMQLSYTHLTLSVCFLKLLHPCKSGTVKDMDDPTVIIRELIRLKKVRETIQKLLDESSLNTEYNEFDHSNVQFCNKCNRDSEKFVAGDQKTENSKEDVQIQEEITCSSIKVRSDKSKSETELTSVEASVHAVTEVCPPAKVIKGASTVASPVICCGNTTETDMSLKAYHAVKDSISSSKDIRAVKTPENFSAIKIVQKKNTSVPSKKSKSPIKSSKQDFKTTFSNRDVTTVRISKPMLVKENSSLASGQTLKHVNAKSKIEKKTPKSDTGKENLSKTTTGTYSFGSSYLPTKPKQAKK